MVLCIIHNSLFLSHYSAPNFREVHRVMIWSFVQEETKSEIPCRVGTAQLESDLEITLRRTQGDLSLKKVKLAYNGGVPHLLNLILIGDKVLRYEVILCVAVM